MCKRQLDDHTSYEILQKDPTECFKAKLNALITHAKSQELIDSSKQEFLTPIHPRIATLPKIHKSLEPLKGRPIVSGVGNLIQNSGIYLDKLLPLH